MLHFRLMLTKFFRKFLSYKRASWHPSYSISFYTATILWLGSLLGSFSLIQIAYYPIFFIVIDAIIRAIYVFFKARQNVGMLGIVLFVIMTPFLIIKDMITVYKSLPKNNFKATEKDFNSSQSPTSKEKISKDLEVSDEDFKF